MRDTEAVATLVPLIGDRNASVARAAVVSLSAIGGQAATDAVTGALEHTRADVRLAAATGLRRLNATAAVPALWRAYRAEKDDEAGVPMARALVALGYRDAASVPVIVGELDQRRQRLWFGHVLLLRHLTGQAIGPIHPEAGTMRERDAELAKWRAWCVAAGHCK
jgi:HEAT repeat protein